MYAQTSAVQDEAVEWKEEEKDVEQWQEKYDDEDGLSREWCTFPFQSVTTMNMLLCNVLSGILLSTTLLTRRVGLL